MFEVSKIMCRTVGKTENLKLGVKRDCTKMLNNVNEP